MKRLAKVKSRQGAVAKGGRPDLKLSQAEVRGGAEHQAKVKPAMRWLREGGAPGEGDTRARRTARQAERSATAETARRRVDARR